MAEKSNNVNTWPISNLEHNKVFDVDQNMGTCFTGSGTFFSLFMPLVERYQANNSIHSMNESLPPEFEKFDMHTSNACHKDFVVFDHTETKNTVILHPSWLNNCTCESSLGPESNRIEKCFLNEVKDFNQQFKEAMPSYHLSSALQPNLSRLNNDDIVQDSTTMQTNLAFKLNRGKCDIGDYHNVQTKYESEMSLSSGNGILNQFHEDTEEINALLSSDDDLGSTGHSPTDAPSYRYNEGEVKHEGDSLIGIKRNLENMSSEENDDADSNETSRSQNKFQNYLDLHTEEKTYYKEMLKSSQVCIGKKTCSSSSEKSLGTLGELIIDPIKRTMIESCVNQLRNVIPGGNGLDTVEVLTRTVQYVMCMEGRMRDLEKLKKIRILSKETAWMG